MASPWFGIVYHCVSVEASVALPQFLPFVKDNKKHLWLDDKRCSINETELIHHYVKDTILSSYGYGSKESKMRATNNNCIISVSIVQMQSKW